VNPAGYCDAHLHLADPRLADRLPAILETYSAIGLTRALVVGTSPADWDRVIELCAQDPRLIPAVGLHPWRVPEAPADWQARLLACLQQGVRVIGEIGLDQWVEGHDLAAQLAAFRWQFALAAGCNLPTAIHCLKAHQPLLETLREVECPARGFKLHAYNGPTETLPELLRLGAYFSFNAGQLKPNAKRILGLIQAVPENRLLIETDAPDFLPAPAHRAFELDGDDPEAPPLNHPGNLRAGYAAIAALRGVTIESQQECVAANFERYFLEGL
jgi:TatD DNase family protein